MKKRFLVSAPLRRRSGRDSRGPRMQGAVLGPGSLFFRERISRFSRFSVGCRERGERGGKVCFECVSRGCSLFRDLRVSLSFPSFAAFVETENDSLVLEVVARELHWLLSHACPKPSEAVVAARVDPESCELSLLVSLLQTLLWTADETVKETALAAFYRLFSLASLSEADEPAAAGKKSATVFINVFLPRLWRLLADGSAKAQQVAAQLLPSALFHLQGTLDDLSRNPAEGSDAPRAEIREKLERSREQLVDAFVKYVCGGPDLSSLTLQLEAGKHLPLFVAFVAKVLHSAPSRFASGDANAKDKLDPTDANAPEAATRILHALREALQAVLRAASEALKMQGIRALAAMAQTDPVVFRTLGDNLLPMLFADPSWRIRAAVCEALDRLGLFLVSSVPSKSSDHGQDKDSSEEEQDSLLPEAALGPGTCIVSVLIQFLKDRDLNVKAAALRTTRKLVKMTGNCSGVLQSFLEEGESIFSAVGISQNAPILVECMATVCTMAEAAKTEEGKWQLTVFAFSLLRVDDWHVALCFLKNLHIFVASPPPSFLSVLLTRLDMLVNLPSSRWRVRACVLQQLPLLLLLPEVDEETSTQLWLLLLQLLQDDVWAVRQEGPAAIEQLVMNVRPEKDHLLEAARARGREDDAISGDRAREESLLATRLAREALLEKLVPVLEQLRDDSRSFVRGEVSRYVLGLQRLYSKEVWNLVFAPLLERIADDRIPQTRYAAAKAIQILLAYEAAGHAPSVVPSEWLQKMKKKLADDPDPDVVEAVLEE
ncbi:HEAT repeat-containing protein [Toxoplasma gondii RUB]|uniref:HEAT repeat-containing protein n=1 Tax=Toxoplasma gondii RUB TaxID=935652 RepID=A0A086M3L9_TOXGO|nr:HEAT repeat-containing protein [Toxoplasma gondii RUB]